MVPKFVDNCLHVASASLDTALHEITLLVFFSQTLHAYTTVLLTCQTAAWPKHSLSTFFLTSVFPILYGCCNSPKSPDITGHDYAGSVQKARSRACDSLIASPSHSPLQPSHSQAIHEPSSRDNTDPGLPSRGCTLSAGQRGEFSPADTSPAVPLTRPERRGWTCLIY